MHYRYSSAAFIKRRLFRYSRRAPITTRKNSCTNIRGAKFFIRDYMFSVLMYAALNGESKRSLKCSDFFRLLIQEILEVRVLLRKQLQFKKTVTRT